MNPQIYEYFDIHTHNSSNKNNYLDIVNIRAGTQLSSLPDYFSFGVHPYDVLDAQDGWLDFDFKDARLMAIGEIGLDARYPEMKRQIELFSRQLEIAKAHNLPVILHSVKSLPQVLKIVKAHAIERFIFHGFNSSQSNADLILSKGGALSFGAKLLSGTMLQKVFTEVFKTNPSQIFFETDDTDYSISQIYEAAASLINTPLLDIQQVTKQNFNTHFHHDNKLVK